MKRLDLWLHRPYVSQRMNVLLLLSALLSALTGVGARVAGPQPVQAVAQESAARIAPAAVAARVVMRPVQALPPLASLLAGPAPAARAFAAIPAWIDRRRE
ncbi:MAG: hypothetical protein QM688_07570 [Sphingomonas bacterium]